MLKIKHSVELSLKTSFKKYFWSLTGHGTLLVRITHMPRTGHSITHTKHALKLTDSIDRFREKYLHEGTFLKFLLFLGDFET